MGEVDIGLRQGRILCQLKRDERLSFIAEGLPVILASALGFWAASQRLEGCSREADVLQNHAEEEAAKILILMDIVRCPERRCGSRLGPMMKWFYDHLARLIYAEACTWRPMHTSQLQAYVDNTRQAHTLEGQMGEYIVPNWELFRRDSALYADVELNEGGVRGWNAPSGSGSRSFFSYRPRCIDVIEAMAALGLFSPEGLRLAGECWGTLEFRNTQGAADSDRLIQQTIRQLVDNKLVTEVAEQKHVDQLYSGWQMPMYNLDFTMIEVPFEQLERERETQFWAEVGIDPY